MRIRIVWAWYDLWIGVYWDRENRRLYILPVPTLGICIRFGASNKLWKCVRAATEDKP